MTIKVTTDTSVLVKGLVPPRRRVKDRLFTEQLNLHLRSSEILKKVEHGEYSNHVPLALMRLHLSYPGSQMNPKALVWRCLM